MDGIQYRQAEQIDLPNVARIWKKYEAFHNSLGLAFTNPPEAESAWLGSFERTLGRFSFLWVAEQGKDLVAFLLARLKRAPGYLGGVMVGEISDLFVEEAVRNRGVGANLVKLAVDHLSTQQVHSIEVQVLVQNQLAIAFWRKLGFRDELLQLRWVP